MDFFLHFKNGIFAKSETLHRLEHAKRASVLVISDSHGGIEALKKVFYTLKTQVDALLFAGDGIEDILHLLIYWAEKDELKNRLPEVLCLVAGNCDYKDYILTFFAGDKDNVNTRCTKTFYFPDYIFLTVCSMKILLTHGHLFGVKCDMKHLAAFAAENGCKAAVYGHSHIRTLTEMNGISLINPGSLTLPRKNSAKGCALITFSEKGIIETAFLP